MSEIVEATPEEQQEIKRVMDDLYRQNYRKAPRVIVAVGRDFNDYKLMKEKLDWLFFASDEFDAVPIKIISGMADGADTLAIRYADEREMTKILFPANWKYHRRIVWCFRVSPILSVILRQHFGRIQSLQPNSLVLSGQSNVFSVFAPTFRAYPLASAERFGTFGTAQLFQRLCVNLSGSPTRFSETVSSFCAPPAPFNGCNGTEFY